MNNKYEFYTIDVYTKGDLKGYANGHITFNYNNKQREHEFLYRFDDKANGNNWELVSVDYGWEIPFIDEVWEELESYLKAYVSKHLEKISIKP